MAVGDDVGVGVGDGLGVAAGEGGGVGETDGVAPGDSEDEGDAVGDAEALSGGKETFHVAFAQEVHSPSVALHSVAPVAHSVMRRVALDKRPQVFVGRGTRMTYKGGALPPSAYCTHQSVPIELPEATEPGELIPLFQFSSTPNAQPPEKPWLPEVQGAPRAMLAPEEL